MGKLNRTRTSARAPISNTVVKRLAWLDLSDVQHRFVAGVGAAASPRERGRVSLEYRRFLLLRLAYPELDIPAPPVIDSYWRVHAADQPRFVLDCESLTRDTEVSPDELVPPLRPSKRAADPDIWDLYEITFPDGSADLWGWPQLRRHRAISRLIAERTGAIVAPCAVGYLYYGSEEFIGIHTDQYGNELTLLTLLSGSVEQLDIHLHLANTPFDEIQKIAAATNGPPEGGTPFNIDAVPFLFSGQRIPHHRAPRPPGRNRRNGAKLRSPPAAVSRRERSAMRMEGACES